MQLQQTQNAESMAQAPLCLSFDRPSYELSAMPLAVPTTLLVEQPFFLVGAERSGTTLLRLMLRQHPKLAWCNEFEYAVDRMSDSGQPPNLEEYYTWLNSHRIFQATGFIVDRRYDYPQLLNSFLCQLRDRHNKLLVGATVHRHFDRLLHIWPNARFIHILRDGRDVARSCIGMGWAGNVWTGVERWIEAEKLWAKLQQELPPERYINIRYEDLITQAPAVLEQLCNFIGISYDAHMLEYDEYSSYGSPDPSLIYQWRKKLTRREIQLVESRIATMLAEHGYELSGLPRISVSKIEAQFLRLQDWWGRLNFRIRRNGLRLLLADYLSRKLRLRRWQYQIRLKLNEIETSYLK